MKKSLIVAASLAALSFSTAASALNTNAVREIRSAGLPVQNFLGEVMFTALGAQGNAVQGQFCTYLMTWTSPYNPNAATSCILRERRTPVNPSCIVNAFQDFTSSVTAGPGAQGGSTFCTGFDSLGIVYNNVSLILGESPAQWGGVVLQGTAIYPTAIPLVHGIVIA